MMDVAIYVAIYYTSLFFASMVFSRGGFHDSMYRKYNWQLSFMLIGFILLYITFRELNAQYFADTTWYARTYYAVCNFGYKETDVIIDKGFAVLTYLCSVFYSHRAYFFIVGLIYMIPVYLAFKREYTKNYFIALLIFVCSFSFAGYGVNGLRNGLATSLCMYAFYSPNTIRSIIFILMAYTMHKSIALPAIIFLITMRVRNVKLYISLWLICLVLVLLFNITFSDFLLNYLFLRMMIDCKDMLMANWMAKYTFAIMDFVGISYYIVLFLYFWDGIM